MIGICLGAAASRMGEGSRLLLLLLAWMCSLVAVVVDVTCVCDSCRLQGLLLGDTQIPKHRG